MRRAQYAAAHLLPGRAVPGAVAAAHLGLCNGGADGLLGPPFRPRDVRVPEAGAGRGPLGLQMLPRGTARGMDKVPGKHAGVHGQQRAALTDTVDRASQLDGVALGVAGAGNLAHGGNRPSARGPALRDVIHPGRAPQARKTTADSVLTIVRTRSLPLTRGCWDARVGRFPAVGTHP